MPKFSVEKSISIDAPADKVFSIISDFKQWRPWSPWLIMEPEASVDVAADGESYTWRGKRVGEGAMAKTAVDPPRMMDCDLTFLKPWKSVSKTRFELVQEGQGTKITWRMEGSLPAFMFFMKKMMMTMIGLDYGRGLAMLKDYAETGSVPSNLEFTGETTFDGCSYVGITNDCAIGEIGPKMKADFERLTQWAKDSATQPAGHPLAIYHKWDMKNGRTRCTTAIPVKELPAETPTGFVTGDVPMTDAYCITHVGPYRHLGNAWSTGMNLGRSKVFRQNKRIVPFETYASDPKEVEEGKLETRVYFPTV